MRVIAIVNPVSGRRDVAAKVQAVARELAGLGYPLEIRPTRDLAEARSIAAEAPEDTTAVLAVGGDGTVREVAAGLVGRGIPLAILPAGTENIVARHFKLPKDPAGIARLIGRGTALRLDVGLVNGRSFLIVCGIGFDARVVERLAAVRRGHIGYLDYVRPLWSTFRHDPFPLLTVVTDGRLLFEGRGLVLVGILPRYSLGLRILARAVHDDGDLDVCVYPCTRRLALIGHALRTALRRHLDSGGVLYRKCQSLQVSSPDRAPIQCDGDPAGTLPARIEIVPSAVRLLVPP